MKGGGDDTIYTSGNGTTLVDEIVYVGVGNALWPGGADPDPSNPLLGRQGAIDETYDYVYAYPPFTVSCEYSILGSDDMLYMGAASVSVVPVPGAVWLGLGMFALLGAARLRRRRSQDR
jgi:MYXO-CTERM domain-containing protein